MMYALELMGRGTDCGCQYQHINCNTMHYRRGFKIINNLNNLASVDDISDEVLKTSADSYITVSVKTLSDLDKTSSY